MLLTTTVAYGWTMIARKQFMFKRGLERGSQLFVPLPSALPSIWRPFHLTNSFSSMFSDSDSSFPQPSYREYHARLTFDSMDRSPNKVAAHLRQLHKENSPERFLTTIEIYHVLNGPMPYETVGFLEKLIRSEMPQSFIDIACDSHNYDHAEYTSDILVRQFISCSSFSTNTNLEHY